MGTVLENITELTEEQKDLLDFYLTDLVQFTRENFPDKFVNFTDADIRMGMIKLMQYKYLTMMTNGEMAQWLMYIPSKDSWLAIPASKAYQERHKDK